MNSLREAINDGQDDRVTRGWETSDEVQCDMRPRVQAMDKGGRQEVDWGPCYRHKQGKPPRTPERPSLKLATKTNVAERQ